ncbi:MAG: methyl-accepting chemotaxis protein [Enterobacterales bacterium]|nr:methyl-accepting chemotaxis protein [Enterobacterales bacterium]
MNMKDSIAFRFNLVALVVVTLLLAGFSFYNYQVTSKRLYQELDQQSSMLLDRLELSLPNTLWNFEMEQLNKVLESEGQANWVHGIFVSDGNKDVANILREANGSLIKGDRPAESKDQKTRILNYSDGGAVSKVGEVTLYIDHTDIEGQLVDSIIKVVLQTLILDIAIILIISRLVQTIVTKPINEVIHALQDIAHGGGDLTQRLNQRPGEMGELAENFNLFVAKIQTLIRQVIFNIESMNESVGNMADIASRTTVGVQNQQAQTDQVSVAMTEMSTAFTEVAGNALETANSAESVSTGAISAKNVLADTVASIRKLAGDIDHGATVINNLQGDVGNIVSVLDVIRGIAEQTNLLALNAAIEAARAGEQGRGFAVVADEVRTLASRTQESTQEIQEMIERLQSGAQEAVDVMEVGKAAGEETVNKANAAESSIDEITMSISTISDMSTQIASAVEEQTAVSEDINRSITAIVEIAEVTAKDTVETNEASTRLTELCGELRNRVERFKV